MSLFHFHKYQFDKKTTTTIDRLMGVAAVLQPMMAIPQIIKIYASKSATDVSLWTWVLLMSIGMIFFAYAIVHRIRPLIVTQLLWTIIDLIIIVGILLYS